VRLRKSSRKKPSSPQHIVDVRGFGLSNSCRSAIKIFCESPGRNSEAYFYLHESERRSHPAVFANPTDRANCSGYQNEAGRRRIKLWVLPTNPAASINAARANVVWSNPEGVGMLVNRRRLTKSRFAYLRNEPCALRSSMILNTTHNEK